MDLIADLRKKIDSHHEEALHALDVLKSYLVSQSIPSTNGNTSSPKTNDRSPKIRRGKTGSYREQVAKVIKLAWASVEQIATETGLKAIQIRGVVNAPALKGKIEVREIGGKKEYRLSSE